MPARRARAAGRLLEAVVAVEDLAGHPDGGRRSARRAPPPRAVAAASALAHRAQLHGAQHRRRVHLAGRRGDQHVVRHLERAPAGVGLAEGGQREGDGAPDLPRERRRAHREARCRTATGSGQRTGCSPRCGGARARPPQRDVALLGAAEALERLAARQVAREHRAPTAVATGMTCRMRSAARYASGLARSK